MLFIFTCCIVFTLSLFGKLPLVPQKKLSIQWEKALCRCFKISTFFRFHTFFSTLLTLFCVGILFFVVNLISMSKNIQNYPITLKTRKYYLKWATAFDIIIQWWNWVSLYFKAVLNEKPPKITGTIFFRVSFFYRLFSPQKKWLNHFKS